MDGHLLFYYLQNQAKDLSKNKEKRKKKKKSLWKILLLGKTYFHFILTWYHYNTTMFFFGVIWLCSYYYVTDTSAFWTSVVTLFLRCTMWMIVLHWNKKVKQRYIKTSGWWRVYKQRHVMADLTAAPAVTRQQGESLYTLLCSWAEGGLTEEGRGANSGTFTCEIDWHQDQTQAGRRQTAICHMSEWTSSSSRGACETD